MTIAIILLLLASMFLLPAQGLAQQWSKDPVVDSIDKGIAASIELTNRIEYCKGEHSHDKECAGIYDNIPWTYMNYDDAVKLGQKQLDEQKAQNAQAPVQQRSLGEIAREQKLLKTIRDVVPDICKKQPDTEFCKSDPAAKEAFIIRLVATKPEFQTFIKTGSLPEKTDSASKAAGQEVKKKQ
jgi:hypothetical protein